MKSITKSLFKSLGVCFAITAMTSCGGDSTKATLEIRNELGDLGKYVSFDSDEATVSFEETNVGGTQFITFSSTITATAKEAVASDYSFGFDAKVLDADLNEIAPLPDYRIDDKSDYDNGGYSSYLPAGGFRASFNESGPVSDMSESKKAELDFVWNQIRTKGKYIVLTPSYNAKFAPYKGGESAGRSSDEAVVDTPVVETVEVEEITAGSSEDWDSVLDEYDTYCTKLASLAKKAKAGDMTAIADYASALESAQALNEKLESATGTMTAAQAARFSKIAAKMASAMM